MMQLRDRVAELLALRREVARILGLRRDLDRNLLDDGETEAVEPGELARVVGQDANRRQAEVGEYLVADPPLRASAGKPSSRFASTVSSPVSCSSYALSLLSSPIPRPSCPM